MQRHTANIMIVDDEPVNIAILKRGLESSGFEKFVTTTQASEVLHLMREQAPDVLLLDIRMPEIDGLEIIQEIQKDEELRLVPIIVLTSMDDPEVKSRALENGACDFLTKPIETTDLFPRICNALRFREIQSNLHQAKTFAEASSKIKGEFLAKMSHEIRTPINGIVGMTELVLESKLDDEQRDCLQTAKQCADHLMELISDILDFSKIESGKLVLESTKFQFREILGTTMSMFRVKACEKDITLRIEIAEDIPNYLVGDPVRVNQVVMNLVGNAIKFTEKGEVSVSVKLMDRDTEHVKLRFDIQDTGIGIPEETQEAIFDAFSQADDSTTRKFGGTGLGLAISSQLAEMMGGSISVKSQPGQGSTFTFIARFGIANEHPPKKQLQHLRNQNSKFHSAKILLVEDNPFNQKVATRMLEKLTHEVHVANDGYEALESLKKEPYDLVFMDVQMPNLDGLETTRRIRRAEQESGHHIPVVALTAHAMAEDRQKCLDAGMDDYLSKPITIDSLRNAIVRILRKKNEQKPSENINQVTSPEKIVDEKRTLGHTGGDVETLHELIDIFLEDCPCRMSDLKNALDEQNADEVYRTIHSLKSQFAFFTEGAPTTTATEIERLAKNSDLSSIGSLSDQLHPEVESLCRELAIMRDKYRPSSELVHLLD